MTNLVRAGLARLTASEYAPLPTAYDALFPSGTFLTAPTRRKKPEPSLPPANQPKMELSQATLDREALAQTLVDARRARTFIDAPSRGAAGFTLIDALAVAERVRLLRIADGARIVGYKVGFTNPAVRAQFGAPAPMAAPVYDDTLSSALRVDASLLLGPRIEPEVVVGVGADGTIAWAALGFEIVQSHVPGWDFGYLDAIADFGLHAALIVGERRAMGELSIAALGAMPVRLSRNGELVERGAGSDVDGGAAGSLTWLRDHLRESGRDLQPGDIVTTGSMTRVPPIVSGERWTIEALGGELAALTIDID